MKVSEIQHGLVVAFLPDSYRAWTKYDRMPENARRDHALKGQIVSLKRYHVDNNGVALLNSALDYDGVPAPEAARAYRLLLKSDRVDNNTNKTVYYLVKPLDIIGLWAPIESRWLAAEAEVERQRQEAQRLEEKRLAFVERERTYFQRIADRIEPTMRSILGSMARPVRVEVGNEWSSQWNGTVPKGTVVLDLRDMESLIEALLEAQDALA